ncbi:hypothetical protein K438DRAFT_1805652 [Mycena galopus ATCC 62051]|nr:hypothetical protein K438DRAFT_1805652 [Mycena galopus ATCC 62051]
MPKAPPTLPHPTVHHQNSNYKEVPIGSERPRLNPPCAHSVAWTDRHPSIDARLNASLPLPTDRTAENGVQIRARAAMACQLQLNLAQLRRVSSSSVSEQHEPPKKPISVYNFCDAEAGISFVFANRIRSFHDVHRSLAASISAAALAGSRVTAPASGPPVAGSSTNAGTTRSCRSGASNGRRQAPIRIEAIDDYVDEPNIFAEMSEGEVAAL